MKKNNISSIKDIKKIKKKLRHFLSKDRLEHSFQVAALSIELAKKYNEDLYYAEVAGLLHDCAKDLPIKDYYKYGISVQKIKDFDFIFENAEDVIHSFASREFAKIEFGITDEYILKAIESHSVGNANMSLLDKIIFVADLVEPGRKIKGIEKIRETAFKNIDDAVIMSFKLIIKYLIKNNKKICLDTIISWNNII